VPRGAMMMAVLVIVGRLDAVVDRRLLVGIGLLLCVAGFWQMARFDLSMTPQQIVWAGVLQGVGQGIAFVPLATLTFATVDPRLRPDASALSNLMRNLGGSIGVALMQALTAYNGQAMHASLAAHIAPGDPVMASGLPAWLSPQTVEGALRLNAEITRQATMVAYVDNFRLMVLLGLLCAPLLLLLRPPAKSAAAAPPPIDAH